MENLIDIWVPAIPISEPRKRTRIVETKTATFAQHYTPTGAPVNVYKATLRHAVASVYGGPPFSESLSMDLLFVMPRPKKYLWKRRAMPRIPHTGKPDLDNLVKSTLDAFKSLLWVDDALVSRMSAEKVIASGDESPGVQIRIRMNSMTTNPVTLQGVLF